MGVGGDYGNLKYLENLMKKKRLGFKQAFGGMWECRLMGGCGLV